MENEFEYLADRGDHGGHLAEKVLKQEYPHVRRGSDLPPDILFCPFKLM